MNIESVSMDQLFKKLGYDYRDMEIGELIDVSSQNVFLKSYDFEELKTIKSKVLGIIRKDNVQEYKVYEMSALGLRVNSLFSGSGEHLIFSKKEGDSEFFWNSLESIFNSMKERFDTLGVISSCRVLNEEGLESFVTVEATGKEIPIIDVQMENGCYFSNGVLSHNTGGNALKFYASVRLEIRKASLIKKGEEVVGAKTKIKIVKNKVAPPFREAEVEMRFGYGLDPMYDLANLALAEGLITRSGAWLSYNGTQLGQGIDKAVEMLKANPEVVEYLDKTLRDIFFSKKE